MIDFEFLERLIQALDDSSVDSLEIERGGTRVRLSKTPPTAAAPMAIAASPPAPVALPAPVPAASAPTAAEPAPAPAAPSEPAAPASDLLEVTSPMVGTFYTASSPDQDPFVSVGTKVTADMTVCIVEAMKVFNEIPAGVSGTIAEILVENGAAVEFGQPLFRVSS